MCYNQIKLVIGDFNRVHIKSFNFYDFFIYPKLTIKIIFQKKYLNFRECISDQLCLVKKSVNSHLHFGNHFALFIHDNNKVILQDPRIHIS